MHLRRMMATLYGSRLRYKLGMPAPITTRVGAVLVCHLVCVLPACILPAHVLPFRNLPVYLLPFRVLLVRIVLNRAAQEL
jgi:hypothetical protein